MMRVISNDDDHEDGHDGDGDDNDDGHNDDYHNDNWEQAMLCDDNDVIL